VTALATARPLSAPAGVRAGGAPGAADDAGDCGSEPTGALGAAGASGRVALACGVGMDPCSGPGA